MWNLVKKYKIPLVIIIILALLIWKFWGNEVNLLSAGGDSNESKYTVKKKNLQLTRTLSGEIDAGEKADLRFQTSGRLSWVGIKVGDIVKKYQAVASLDQRELKKTLDKKLLAYMNERWDFEQTREDYKDVMLTDAVKKIREKSQFDLDDTVLSVELQSISVEYASLWTPIAGVVTKIDAPEPGVNITPATAEIQVINPDSVYLSVSADQNEVVGLTGDMKADIVFDSYPDETVTGKIDTISFTPKAGESSAVYEVKVKFPADNSSFKYRMEMTADATFVIKSRKNVLSVPAAAVKSDGKGNYVFADQDGKKVKTYVKTGTEFDEDTEITSGLKEKDLIYD